MNFGDIKAIVCKIERGNILRTSNAVFLSFFFFLGIGDPAVYVKIFTSEKNSY